LPLEDHHMKFTVALLALLTISLSAGPVAASVGASGSGYQAAAHHRHHRHHHRRHHRLDDGRGELTLKPSALV
jgi:hypothetical protein